MLMELPDTKSIPIPHHGFLVPAMVLGGAIGAARSKSGHIEKSVVKGAAFGALAAYGLFALFGAAMVGVYLYTRSKYGPDKAHELVQKLSTTKPGN